MTRQRSTPLGRLLEEARQIEVLVEDLSPPTQLIEEYWDISMALIGFLTRLEGEIENLNGTDAEEAYARFRTELSRLEGRIAVLDRRSESG